MKRIDQLDFLRAVAIIGVILIHSILYKLGTPFMNSLWNYLHFVVPLLVYCSGFLVYKKYADFAWTPKAAFSWFKKRTVRLVVPYFLWNGAHLLLWKLLPQHFSGIGLDNDWIPILFLELMLVTPLYIAFWKSKYRPILIALILLSTLVHPSVDYRFYMWLPWSSVVLLSFAAAEYGVSARSVAMAAVSALGVFVAGNVLLSNAHVILTLTRHKFPPDLFYLSYGVFIGSVLILAEPHIPKQRVSGVITWLSKHSYDLFFASYFVIDFVVTALGHVGR